MDYIFILVGFAVLILGAHYLVDGASGLAKRFKISDLVIGLTVVAFGTSAPELVVNIVASLNPTTTDIALTNIIGSNMINMYVILGFAAVVYPISTQRTSRKFDMPMSLLAALMVLILVVSMDNTLTRLGGLILLAFFVWFLASTIRRSLKHPDVQHIEHFKPVRIWVAVLMIVGGLAALIGGAQLIVPSATRIAESWGVSQSLIGLTIVALGTSLPELATSAVAAFKKNSDIALGNVLGSNIFNIFFILAASAIIRPLPAYNNIIPDLIMVIFGSALLMLFVYSNKKHTFKRWGGATFLVIYALYLFWIIYTGRI
jgi:cation:H+ antiporter